MVKKLPQLDISFDDLYEMIIAPLRSKLLLAGIELKVFNQLSAPGSAEAVAQAIGAHAENTRLLLDGLAACDLVLKKNGLYRNTPLAQTFLVESSPTYLGRMLAASAQLSLRGLDDLSRLVQEGPPSLPPETDTGSGDGGAHSLDTMVGYERAGAAQQAVEIVSALPEFPSFRKMLDLGGGPGLIGMAIVAAHPSIRGVIFDLPSVVTVTETFIKEYGMEDRMEVLGGDYNHHPIGEGYDLIWASATLYFAQNMDAVIKKIYEALNPGGVFVSFSDGLTHERTKPEIMVLSWLPTALMGQDMGFDQGFIADSMLRVGFKSVRSRPLDTPIGPMDLDIGRK